MDSFDGVPIVAVEPPEHIFWNLKNACGGLELAISIPDSQRRKKGWAR